VVVKLSPSNMSSTGIWVSAASAGQNNKNGVLFNFKNHTINAARAFGPCARSSGVRNGTKPTYQYRNRSPQNFCRVRQCMRLVAKHSTGLAVSTVHNNITYDEIYRKGNRKKKSHGFHASAKEKRLFIAIVFIFQRT